MGEAAGSDRRDLAQSKAKLRRAIKALIARLAPDDRRAQEASLRARFPDLPGFARAETVLLFVSARPEEPATSELFDHAYAVGKRVLCPRVDCPERRLRLHQVADPATDLEPGMLGIREPGPDLLEVDPAAVDWVLVPGLAFDVRGFRLGRGGGFYDRLLPKLRADAICWAICLNCQLVPEIPVESHDAPLNGLSTPDRDVTGIRERIRRDATTLQ